MLKLCKAVVVASTLDPGKVSLRTKQGRSVKTGMTEAGFEIGEEVVIILKSKYEFLKDLEERERSSGEIS